MNAKCFIGTVLYTSLLVVFPTVGQTVSILSPAGGDTVTVGDTLTVELEWDSDFEDAAPGMVISFSPDGGLSYIRQNPIQSAVSSSISLFVSWANFPQFIIPDTLWNTEETNGTPLAGSQFRIRVEAYGDASLSDVTDCCIAIVRPIDSGIITIQSVFPAESLTLCDTLTVNLAADSAFQATFPAVYVEYSPDGGANWFTLNPLQFPTSPHIPFFADWALSPMFLVPDTLKSAFERDTLFNDVIGMAVSDQGMLRVRPAQRLEGHGDTLCCITLSYCLKDTSDTTQQETEEDDGGDIAESVCGDGSVNALFVPVVWRIAGRFSRRKKKKSRT